MTSRDREIQAILEGDSSGGGMGRRAFVALAAAGVGAGLAGGVLRAHRRGILFPEIQDPGAFLAGLDEPPSRLSLLAGAVLLSPSAYNAQPWILVEEGDSLHLFVDPARSGGALDTELKELFMGAGSAIESMRIAASASGRPVTVQLLPDPNDLTLVCRLRWAEEGLQGDVVDDDPDLFRTMPARRTHRGEMGGLGGSAAGSLPLPAMEADLAHVAWAPAGSEAQIRTVVNDSVQSILAEPDLVQALSRWLRPGPSSGDGAGLGPESLATTRGQAASIRFRPDRSGEDLLRLWAQGPGQGGGGGEVGALFVDRPDSRAEQIRAGMAWHRLHLRLTVAGMGAQPLNSPLRLGWYRRSRGEPSGLMELADLLGHPGGEPVLVFRAGGVEAPGPARRNRRDLRQVLIQGA